MMRRAYAATTPGRIRMLQNVMYVRSAAALLAALAGSAVAQPALVTAPQTLNPGATTILDVTTGNNIPLATAQITVRNTILTVNGRHSIASLTLENQGEVTHAPATQFDYSGGAGTDVVRGLHIITTGGVALSPRAFLMNAASRCERTLVWRSV